MSFVYNSSGVVHQLVRVLEALVPEVHRLLPAEALFPDRDVVFVQLLWGVRLRSGKVDSQVRQS